MDEHGADARARKLSTKSLFLTMLYGQLSAAESLRDIVGAGQLSRGFTSSGWPRFRARPVSGQCSARKYSRACWRASSRKRCRACARRCASPCTPSIQRAFARAASPLIGLGSRLPPAALSFTSYVTPMPTVRATPR